MEAKWMLVIERRLWQMEGKSKVLHVLLQTARIVYMAGREFMSDKCGLRSSALTYYSTLSLVPILALLFGIAKGFGFQEKLRNNILESAGQNQEIYLYMFDFAENTLSNARGGVIAGIGIVVLFYTLIKTISLIETSFNDIWQVKTPRTWIRKFTDYLSITLLAPFAVIISSSATVFISTNVRSLQEQNELIEMIGPVLHLGLEFIPFLMIWILFLAIYMIMPNRKINLVSALIGAVVAGTAYQVVEWAYITFQVGVSEYNGIYGSFAALPLFLIWVQTSWNIVLFGAELSYAHQNLDQMTNLRNKRVFSPIEKIKVAMMTLHVLLKHYQDEKPYMTLPEIAEEVQVPQENLLHLLDEMEEKNLVVHLNREKDTFYQPARSTEQLDLAFVIRTFLGEENESLPDTYKLLDEDIEKLAEDLEKSSGNRSLSTF